MILALALAVDLCAGRVTDRVDHPMLPAVLDPVTLTAIQGKPPIGQYFLDPSFGSQMVRITGAPTSEGENAVIKPLYSTVQAWNSDESLILLWHRGKGHELYEGEYPYRFVASLPIAPTDLEHVIWSPDEPRTLYYPKVTGQGRSLLMKVTLGPPYAEEIIADFNQAPASCPIGVNHNQNRYGLGADPDATIAGARKILGFMCGPQGSRKFIYSITENAVLHAWTANAASKVGPIAPVVDQSEKYVFLTVGALNPSDPKTKPAAFRVDLANLANARLLPAVFPYEHSQVGRAFWHTVAYNESSPGANDSGALVSHDFTTGTHKVVVGPATGYSYIPAGLHVSATGPHPWVFLSAVGGAHTGQFALDNEMLLANVETGAVCRVGHTRTWAGTNCGPLGNQCPGGYFAEGHGALSRKGTRAVFGSDGLGFTGLPWRSTDTYVLDLRKPPIKVRLTSLCDVQSLSPHQSKCATERFEVVP